MSDGPDPAGEGATDSEPDVEAGADSEDLAAVRREVEEAYDFEDFGPTDMEEMSPEEWEAAFDPGTWITGEELLDRVAADLKNKVAGRDVFARVERLDDLLIAYSDSGYAAVYPDGSVEGRGTVLRDVKPIVALCSMDSYDVPEPPDEEVLPQPQEIPESSDALGNTVLQIVAGVQVLAGLVLFGALFLSASGLLGGPGGPAGSSNLWLLAAAGTGFLVVGVLLFMMVANARLSDKFRAEEFRNRLRAIGLEDGERPDFLAEIEGLEDELPGEAGTGGESGGDGADSAGDAARERTSGRE